MMRWMTSQLDSLGMEISLIRSRSYLRIRVVVITSLAPIVHAEAYQAYKPIHFKGIPDQFLYVHITNGGG